MALSMKKLDRTCLVIVVIISVICGYLVVRHVANQKRQLRQENDLLSKKLNDLDMANTNLEHLKSVLETTRRELKVINEQIPENANIGTLLKKIDPLMMERKVVLINIEILPLVEDRHYIRIPINLKFKGSFGDTYKILHDLETMDRMIVMEKINIAKSNTDKLCKVDLTISVFER